MNVLSPGLTPLEEVKKIPGLEFLKGISEGRFPPPPIAHLLGFTLTEVEEGRALFTGTPDFRLYNPIGSVHGGFSATLLDSALGCAIFSTLAKGETWTTLELKLNFVRGLSNKTGTVRAEGRVSHRGRSVATSEGDIRDRDGKLYAHATTNCMIFPAQG